MSRDVYSDTLCNHCPSSLLDSTPTQPNSLMSVFYIVSAIPTPSSRQPLVFIRCCKPAFADNSERQNHSQGGPEHLASEHLALFPHYKIFSYQKLLPVSHILDVFD